MLHLTGKPSGSAKVCEEYPCGPEQHIQRRQYLISAEECQGHALMRDDIFINGMVRRVSCSIHVPILTVRQVNTPSIARVDVLQLGKNISIGIVL